jgi:large subunit ribosomal protein L32e
MTEPKTITPKKALKLRKNLKRKKPSFVRHESWRYMRLKENWRRPRGLDNKMRRRIKGWPPVVSIGYKGPKIARGLHPSGYREVLVHNAEELEKVDPKTQAIRIAHTVGKRKKAGILAVARKKKVIILNLKEIKEAAESEEQKTEETAEREEKTVEEKMPRAAAEAKREREKTKTRTKGGTSKQ